MENFYKSYACASEAIRVGDEYKVLDLERDPFYSKMASEYRKIEFLGGTEWGFNKAVFQQLELFVMYYEGEYTETTNEEFKQIWPEFLKNWYLHHIYVCYSDEMLKIEVDSWKDREDLDFDKCRGNCKFRLFRKVKQINNDVWVVSSVYSGLTYEVDLRRIPMVRGSFNEGLSYLWWWELSKEVVALEQMYKQSQKLALKRIIRQEKDPNKSIKEDKSLKDIHPVFNVGKTEVINNNSYELFDVMPPEAPKLTLESFLNWFNWRAGQLGYMGDMNEKKERVTTGENFQNLHGISNIQNLFLSRLLTFAKAFNNKYPEINLNFNISNWGETSGLPQPSQEQGDDEDEVVFEKSDESDS